MCGIVGVLGNHEAAPLLVEALKRLEYRGYDSAGIATVNGGKAGPPPRGGQAGEPVRPSGA
jgi:glutamine---fructose-6-phosphate transaminase (isomerizing)